MPPLFCFCVKQGALSQNVGIVKSAFRGSVIPTADPAQSRQEFFGRFQGHCSVKKKGEAVPQKIQPSKLIYITPIIWHNIETIKMYF